MGRDLDTSYQRSRDYAHSWYPEETCKILLYLKGKKKIIYLGGFQVSDEYSVQIN